MEKSGKDAYNHVLDEYMPWLKKRKPDLETDTYYRDAYRFCRPDVGSTLSSHNIDLTFADVLNDDDGEENVYKVLKMHYTDHPTKNKSPAQSAEEYREYFIYLKDFLKDRPDLMEEVLIAASNKSKNKNNGNNKHKAQEPSKNKPISPIPPINPPPEQSHSGNPHEIVHRAMENITEINQNCNNHRKNLIFKEEVHKLSRSIENPCTSKELFINFSLNLYIMIYETTRKKSNNVNNDKRKPYYDFLLPHEFYRKGTDTRHFMDIVGTLRHHYAHHLEPEYIEQIDKIPYEDVLEELLKTKEEPTSKEDFLKLQIAVLEKFEASMKRLLEIVKNDLNPPKPH